MSHRATPRTLVAKFSRKVDEGYGSNKVEHYELRVNVDKPCGSILKKKAALNVSLNGLLVHSVADISGGKCTGLALRFLVTVQQVPQLVCSPWDIVVDLTEGSRGNCSSRQQGNLVVFHGPLEDQHFRVDIRFDFGGSVYVSSLQLSDKTRKTRWCLNGYLLQEERDCIQMAQHWGKIEYKVEVVDPVFGALYGGTLQLQVDCASQMTTNGLLIKHEASRRNQVAQLLFRLGVGQAFAPLEATSQLKRGKYPKILPLMRPQDLAMMGEESLPSQPSTPGTVSANSSRRGITLHASSAEQHLNFPTLAQLSGLRIYSQPSDASTAGFGCADTSKSTSRSLLPAAPTSVYPHIYGMASFTTTPTASIESGSSCHSGHLDTAASPHHGAEVAAFRAQHMLPPSAAHVDVGSGEASLAWAPGPLDVDSRTASAPMADDFIIDQWYAAQQASAHPGSSAQQAGALQAELIATGERMQQMSLQRGRQDMISGDAATDAQYSDTYSDEDFEADEEEKRVVAQQLAMAKLAKEQAQQAEQAARDAADRVAQMERDRAAAAKRRRRAREEKQQRDQAELQRRQAEAETEERRRQQQEHLAQLELQRRIQAEATEQRKEQQRMKRAQADAEERARREQLEAVARAERDARDRADWRAQARQEARLQVQRELLQQRLAELDSRMEHDYSCPITHEVMEDPVVAADGHTYERSAIEEWLEMQATSPLTNAQLLTTSLSPNWNARSALSRLREERARLLQDIAPAA